MIYEHKNYRRFLKAVLAKKCHLNSSYSLRAFAGHLKISPSMLSEVLKEKKHLSIDMALHVADTLKLPDKEKEYFYNLVMLETSKNFELKEILEKKINKMKPKNKVSDLSLEMFRVISDPASVIILELAGMNTVKLDDQAAAKITGINRVEAQVIIERLVRLNLIEKNDESYYIKKNDDLLVQSEMPNGALRAFHKKMLEKASESLTIQSNKEKFVGSETFGFNEDQLEEAKEILEECFSRITVLAKNTDKKNAVYHLGIQLFNLTKKGTIV